MSFLSRREEGVRCGNEGGTFTRKPTPNGQGFCTALYAALTREAGRSLPAYMLLDGMALSIRHETKTNIL